MDTVNKICIVIQELKERINSPYRVGQAIKNALHTDDDLFYIEDEQLLERLRKQLDLVKPKEK